MQSTDHIKILYVEDDESLAFITKDNLEQHGYHVTHAANGKEAFEIYKLQNFHLGIIDIMLPDMDGFSLVEKIRMTNQQIPILFLTAKVMQEDKIKGFTLGGDDYITKPFSIKELLLRIEVFLKRSEVKKNSMPRKIQLRDIIYEHDNLLLKVKNKEYHLTHKEGLLLNYLLINQNKILKRDDILIEVWGESDYFLGRSLDVFISRLRKMLGKENDISIENIHGVGFRLKISATKKQ